MQDSLTTKFSPCPNKNLIDNNTHKTIFGNTELNNIYITTRQYDTPRYLYNSSYKHTSGQDRNPIQVKTIPHHSTSTVKNSTNTVENSLMACSTQKNVTNDEIIPSDNQHSIETIIPLHSGNPSSFFYVVCLINL